MQINKKNNQTSFERHISIKLNKISPEVRSQLAESIKKEIGEGLITKKYKASNIEQSQDIFVGFNYEDPEAKTKSLKQITIATGNDLQLLCTKGKENAQAKIKQIDIPILNKIKEILNNLGIKNEKGIVKSQSGVYGQINKGLLGRKITILSEEPNRFIDIEDIFRKSNKGFQHVSSNIMPAGDELFTPTEAYIYNTALMAKSSKAV